MPYPVWLPGQNGAPRKITRCIPAPRPDGPSLKRCCALLPAMLFELPVSWLDKPALYRWSYEGRISTGVTDGIQTHSDWGHVPAR